MAVAVRGVALSAERMSAEQLERAAGAGLSFDEVATLVLARDGYAGEWWGIADGDVTGFRAYAHVPAGRSVVEALSMTEGADAPVLGVVLIADVPEVDGRSWEPELQHARAESLLGSSYLPPGTSVTLREVNYNAGDRWRSAHGTRVIAASRPASGEQQSGWQFVDRRRAPEVDVASDQAATRILLEVREAVHRAVEFAQSDPDRSRQWAATAKSEGAAVILDAAVQPSTREKARLLVEEADGLQSAANQTLAREARSRTSNDFPAPATSATRRSREWSATASPRPGGRRTRPVIER